MRLLKEESVAVIPGDGFGCDDYIRLSFAVNVETIKKGIDRLESWLKKIWIYPPQNARHKALAGSTRLMKKGTRWNG